MQTITFRIDQQWGPTVQHGELCPVSRIRTWWKITMKKKKTQIYVYVWLGHFAIQQKLKEPCKLTTLIKICLMLKKDRQPVSPVLFTKLQ